MKYILFMLFVALQAEIVELNSFKDLSSHLTPDTLVVLDIDDTLLIPKQMLGCDEWFQYRLQQRKSEGTPDALEKTIAEWEAVRHLTQMELVEPSTEKIVQSLQNSGYCVMGLTTQGLALATRTVEHLNEQGIDLTLTAPAQEDVYFTVNKHGVLYRKGILFTSGTSKGESLFQLCKEINQSVNRIVFVNDKATHIADIEAAANARKVEFLGLRYAYSDAKKAAFRPEIAELQFNRSSFSTLLSDEEARVLSKTTCR